MKHILLLAVIAICFWTCRKEPPPKDCPTGLPCATDSGEHTFGCYINGKPWVAKIEPFVLDPSAHKIEATYDETDYGAFNDNYFRLLGSYRGDSSTSLIIHFKPLTAPGKVLLDVVNAYGVEFRTLHKLFKIAPEFPYEINFTKIDIEKNIISGTYYFTGISGVDTILVTDGRFDVRYGQE